MKFSAAVLAMTCVALAAGCGGTEEETNEPTVCTPTGTWHFDELRTGGTCSNEVAPDSTTKFTIATSGTNSYSFTQLDSSGKPVQGVNCSGTLDKNACKVRVTCAASTSGSDEDGAYTFTVTVSYDAVLGSDGKATGTESGTLSVARDSGTDACDASWSIAGSRI